jgi:hypothetical protein
MKVRRVLHAQPANTVSACPTSHVCFLYIAQAHQVLHSLSVAVALARTRPDIQVDVAATDASVLDYARLMVELMGHAPIGWRLLGPGWLRAIRMSDGTPPKVPMLALNAHALSAYDVIVAPERTTAALRDFGIKAKLVYTQHGAGDREGPFEARLGKFDLVFAAGSKQRDRMIAEGLVEPDHCAIVGYPKFDLVDQLRPILPRLFAETRPTVLYNPHFDPELSSWPLWGRQILDAFAGQSRYNLIFAPHLRLFGSRPPSKVAELAPYLGHRGIHMDLGGTSASIDMTYARVADIYLGDVSSQVYEFIRQPRPCLFLNPGQAAWRFDKSYSHWRFGPVVDNIEDLFPTIAAARTGHAQFRQAQLSGFAETFAKTSETASQLAANAIAGMVGRDWKVAMPTRHSRTTAKLTA